MRYPLSNVPRPYSPMVRLGGLSDDYAKDVSNFKDLLSKQNQAAQKRYDDAHKGEPVYRPPQTPSAAPESEPGAPTFEPRYFPPPPARDFTRDGKPLPMSVASGGGVPTEPGQTPYQPPPPPQSGKCSDGFSWIAGVGCVKNTPSDPGRPPSGPTIPVNPGPRPGGFGPSSPALPGTSVATGLISEPSTMPLPPPPPAPVKPSGAPVASEGGAGMACYSCGGSLRWGYAGPGCIPVSYSEGVCKSMSHAPVGGIPGGTSGPSSTIQSGFNPIDSGTATFAMAGFLPRVPLLKRGW